MSSGRWRQGWPARRVTHHHPTTRRSAVRQYGGPGSSDFTPTDILHANFRPEPNAPAFMLSRVPAARSEGGAEPSRREHVANDEPLSPSQVLNQLHARERKTTQLVLVVRGTSTLADVSSDLKVLPSEVSLDPTRHAGRTSGWVHSGMLAGARSVIRSLVSRELPCQGCHITDRRSPTRSFDACCPSSAVPLITM